MHFSYFLCPAAADPRPAQRADETDDEHEPDRPMDIDEERDFADRMQELRSLEVDLADAAQEEGDGAEESVSAAAVDKECEASACELGIPYPTLQSIYAGKLNKQSIQVYIISYL